MTQVFFKRLPQLWILILGCLVFSGCSQDLEKAKRACKTYLEAFQKEDYDTMWSLLSSGQKRKIANQLVILKTQKGKKVALRGLMEVDTQKIQSWAPKDYYVTLLKNLHHLLKTKKEGAEIFDLLHCVVEKGELKGNRAIITIFDGSKRRKLLVIKEKEKDQELWKIDEEYVFLSEEER